MAVERIASTTKEIDETVAVSPGGTFFAQLDRGSIEVESHDANEVRLVARASGVSSERASFSVAKSGNDVHLDMLLDGVFAGLFGPRVKVTARVPRDYSVDLDTRGGRVEVADIGGDCFVRTSGSRIEVSGADGDVAVRTSGGGVRVEDVGGDLTVATSGGKLETSGGSIAVEDVLGCVGAKSSGGKICVRFGHDASGRLETSGGSIEVAYPRDTGLRVDARTSGGTVEIAESIRVDGRVDKQRVKAELDGGGGELELKTSGGSIRIDTWSPPTRSG
jgi:hypothetical protein